MSTVGTPENPLRVAIIGSGPAGFYAADHLIKQKDLSVEIDMFDRLPTPFGLVRAGVAPDHQKIKSVTRAFDRTASRPNFRFFGNVEFGKDLCLDDLKAHYHQLLFSTGSPNDRKLGIPGEDLRNSHPATEFVAWYNGHPDFRDYEFDLDQETAVVIGVGNVAMDVARILSRTPEELAQTDMADYAIEALSKSKIKTIYILGRRGPAQAAFTPPEIKELGEMPGADIMVPADEAQLDSLSQATLSQADRPTQTKVEVIQAYGRRKSSGKPKQLILRFLVSPVELIGDDEGKVTAMRLVKNKLYETDTGGLRPRATEEFEEIPAGLVFRSVGYRGAPLPDLPFDEHRGVLMNQKGRVCHSRLMTRTCVGLYTAGWIKRGPTGVIGTNKPDAVETANCMLEDLAADKVLIPERPDRAQIEDLMQDRQIRYVTYEDWKRLNEIEESRGKEQGRPRVKFTDIAEMIAVLTK